MRYDVRFFSSDDMYTRKDPRSGFEMQVKLPDTSGAAHPFAKFSHQFSGISASIGASWNLTDKLLIKANIARGFRTPNISEISANGVHPGTNIYQLGNENFKPEFSLQEDLGIFYTSKVISGFIQAFFSDISNYIFNQKVLTSTGKDSVIVKGNQTFQFEQSHAQLYGGEAMLDIHPLKRDWLHFENSVSVVYAINKGTGTVHVQDSSRYLPFIPPLHFHSEIRAEIKKKFTHLSGIYAKISLEYFARQNRVYLAFNTETPTSGYLLLDGGIGASITKKSGKILFTLMIAGDNLADAAYQSHLSRLKYFEEYPGNASGKNGIYDMGRNIAVKVIVPVDFR